MDGAVELHDITGRTVSANDESDYETPTASKNEENEYMKISTLAETTIGPITDKYIPAGNVDKVTKPEINTAAFKKVYIFCCIILIMNVISFVTIGILTYTLMKRADATEVKSDELQATIQKIQGIPTALTETGPESFKVLETKVLEIESRVEVIKANSNTKFLDHSTKITDLEHDKSFHATLIQDHGARITQLETNKVATIENSQKLGTRIVNLETYQTAALAKSNKLNNTMTQLEANMTSLGVAVSNNSFEFRQIHAGLEKAHIALVNLNSTTETIELNRHSDIAIITANQRRISNLEVNSSNTNSLYENLELRLNYLEDGLNCTWSPWSPFSSCTATCGLGIHYRERHCNGLNPDFSDHWCSRKETDIQTCNIQSCEPAFDCKDILQNGISTVDGVYYVILNETRETIKVYCDMTSDGGGWTVFQKRFNGSVDFYKNFHDYENGFGSVSGECWMGLKYIYQMTKGVNNELRLDLEKSTGQKAYATYQSFSLSGPSNYTLNIGNYSGTAGDGGIGLSYNNGSAFTTYDRDVDASSINCGERDHGGWWYKYCTNANLNGEYVTPGILGSRGVWYYAFDDQKSLKSTEMKFRRKS